MAHLSDEELVRFYHEVKAKWEKCVERKRNPYKKPVHYAYLEMRRRGLIWYPGESKTA
ncbi:MAG TPA: hypothetical protein VHY08_20830 [Bacillota bacterium]|nr:hypothetical protein [Bacillota bacterium]